MLGPDRDGEQVTAGSVDELDCLFGVGVERLLGDDLVLDALDLPQFGLDQDVRVGLLDHLDDGSAPGDVLLELLVGGIDHDGGGNPQLHLLFDETEVGLVVHVEKDADVVLFGDELDVAPHRSESRNGVAVPGERAGTAAQLEEEIRVGTGRTRHQPDGRVRLGDVARDQPEPLVERVVVHRRQLGAAVVGHQHPPRDGRAETAVGSNAEAAVNCCIPAESIGNYLKMW